MPEPSPIRIATRGSALALAQARFVLSQCHAAFPGVPFELKIIKTTGDKLLTASLANAEMPKGLFTKELEVALLNGEADLAVHSLKDLPTDLPAGLKLGAVGKRADVRDVLVHRRASFQLPPSGPGIIQGLPQEATVATSSTRRSAQLRNARPDLKIVPIRGNVGTRLKKVAAASEMEATILAAAGLGRLKIQIPPAGQLTGEGVPPGLGAACLDPEEMLPCVGQAALGIEVRDTDERTAGICAALDHPPTHQCVMAERAFLQGMGGGCHLAVAAYAEVEGDEIRLRAVSFLRGSPVRGERRCPISQAADLGQRLAADLGGPPG